MDHTAVTDKTAPGDQPNQNPTLPIFEPPAVKPIGLSFGKKGKDNPPPQKVGACDTKKCKATGIVVYQLYHKQKNSNKDKFYCPTCINKFRDMAKARTKK